MTGQKEIVLVPWALSAALEQALAAYKFIYITAPAGWGKTTAVRRYFRGRRYTYASLWDEDALDRVAADSTALVILDDCHVLEDHPCLCKRVETLLRETPAEAHVLLLSRAPLPDWLFPFQLTGLLTVLRDEVFQLGAEDVAKLEIGTGDFISFDPMFVYTESGFIKSRHLDDKASVAVLMGVLKDMAEQNTKRSVEQKIAE